MSFRYLKADDSIGTVDTIQDLFDPRKNTHWLDGEGHFQWAKMLKILNVFFCKENVTQYEFAKLFVFHGSRLTVEEHIVFRGMISELPEDQHYLIGFMRRDRRLNSTNPRYQIVSGTFSEDVGSSYMSFDPNWAQCADISKEYFATAMNDAHKALKEKVFDRARSTTKWPVNYLNVAAPATLTFFRFISGSRIIAGSPSLSASTLMSDLGDEGFRYTVDINLSEGSVLLKTSRTVTRGNRRALYNVLQYTANALDILPYPNMEKKEKGPILVGVELEVSTDYTPKDLVDAAEDPFFLCKSDASITGSKSNRMELVTAPSSFKYLKRQYALWFNKLDYTKFDCTINTSNGMHVHVGKDHFEDENHIRNFCWFLNNPANLDFLVQISERTKENLHRWSPTITWGYGSSRTRCFRNIKNFVVNQRGITNFKGGWEDSKTVEVRMFKGIVSYAAIVKNLEFVEAVFHFTKGLTSYRELTLRGFFKWLDLQSRNRFILLRKFIDQEMNVEKLLLHADLKDVIFVDHEPEKIAKKLSLAPFKVTNEHITILNRREKKRVYTLNKETGEVSFIQHNIAKLASYDKSFAERYTRHLNTDAA